MFLKCISVFPAPMFNMFLLRLNVHCTQQQTQRAVVIDLVTNDSFESVRLMNQTKSLQNKRRAV